MAKAFQTPHFTSEVNQCRTLTTPSNKEWLGVFNSALLEMLNPYNWEQVDDTDLTIEETIAMVELILAEYFLTPNCGACLLPGLDTPPFRLGEDGRFEMLDPATGEWGVPTGEYEIPPTPEREEATEEERLCAAAANAANVMKALYEAITDEIALGGDALQVAAAMVAALVTAVGGWIAAPVYAIIQLTIALFAGMIELLQVLGGDVWTTEFDRKLKCALLDCATDTGDVVTFDLTCIREKLTVEPDVFSPTWFYELQLFAQVLYLLEVITMDGLNAAGATTAIADPYCGDCDAEWCRTFDFTGGAGLHGWTIDNGIQDTGGLSDPTTSFDALTITSPAFSEATHLYQIEVWMNAAWTGGSPRIIVANDATFTMPWLQSGTGALPDHFYITIDATVDGLAMNFDRQVGATQRFDALRLQTLTLYGTGINPFGADNC